MESIPCLQAHLYVSVVNLLNICSEYDMIVCMFHHAAIRALHWMLTETSGG